MCLEIVLPWDSHTPYLRNNFLNNLRGFLRGIGVSVYMYSILTLLITLPLNLHVGAEGLNPKP